MGGKASRDKGGRVERELVNRLNASGEFEARRVPLSGAAEGFKGDIQIRIAGRTLKAEVKARKDGNGFKVLEKWKGDNDYLFLKRDRQEPMVVMDFETFTQMLFCTARERNRDEHRN